MTKAFKTNITAPAIIKAGGTSTQYLMADGSVTTGGSGVKYTYSSTPPSSPTAGDIWVDSGDGTEYTYVADGDSNQWVELSNAGLPGPSGATGSSGTVIVNSPIVNTGTSTSAILSLDTTVVPRLATSNTFTASPQQININSSSNNGLVIKAASSQTADIQQWQDSGSNILAKIASDGSASFANSFFAGKNAIVNGGMDFWQRSTSVASGTAAPYTVDRWQGYRGSLVAGETVSRQTAGLTGFQYCARVQRDSGNAATNQLYLATSIESVNTYLFAGQYVTLSFYARAGANFSSASNLLNAAVNTGTGTDQNLVAGFTGNSQIISSNVTLTTTWQRFTMTAQAASTATQFGVGFTYTPTGTAGTNDYFEITGVQLEIGSTATPFSRAGGNIQGELAACQRYYFRSTPGNGAGQYGTGLTSTTTTAYCYINLPVPMRVIPTAVESNSLQVIDRVAATAYAASGIGLSDGTSTNFIELSMTIATATAGRFVALRNATSAGYLGFTAEL